MSFFSKLVSLFNFGSDWEYEEFLYSEMFLEDGCDVSAEEYEELLLMPPDN